jgi:type I restriction enzyme S subunit
MNLDGNEVFMRHCENTVSRTTVRELGAQIFEENSIIFPKVGAALLTNKRRILTQPSCIDNNVMVLTPTNGVPKYLYYHLLNIDLGRLANPGAVPSMNESQAQDIEVMSPPLPEQRAIAAFLDERSARLDAAIAEYRRLADLLREQRAALISHTVTQGLDPDVPRKDSGIAWLGEIPAHWEVMRIKYLLHDIVDTEHKTAPFYPDGEYLVVRTSNIRNGQLIFDDAKYTDFEGFVEWTQRGVPEPGDILFTREAPAGEACIVPAEVPLCIGQRTVLLRVNQNVLDSQFALWSLYSGVVEEFIELLSQGSTVDHLNMADIPNIPIVYPPLPEQRAIAAHLDRETARIDAALAEIDAAIDHLEAYRAALIAAAVTGKIDVRQV